MDTDSFGQLSIHHEVVNMFFCSCEFEFPGDDCYYQSCASSSLSVATEKKGEKDSVEDHNTHNTAVSEIDLLTSSYHETSCDCYSSTAVCVGYDVTVTHGQESNRCEPHGI